MVPNNQTGLCHVVWGEINRHMLFTQSSKHVVSGAERLASLAIQSFHTLNYRRRISCQTPIVKRAFIYHYAILQ